MRDIDTEAWRQIITMARSKLDDWIDEDGTYSDAEYDAIYNRARNILNSLEADHL